MEVKVENSTFNALKYLIKQRGINKVLIHDVARPNFSVKLLNSIISNMRTARATVPKIKVQDANYRLKQRGIHCK